MDHHIGKLVSCKLTITMGRTFVVLNVTQVDEEFHEVVALDDGVRSLDVNHLDAVALEIVQV